jgi:hypothetical protein
MPQNYKDNILQVYNSLPKQMQEEVWDFMQYLVNKLNNENIDLVANKKDSNQKKKRQIGYFPKGTFVLTEDFDAPLDCFNEYMQ